MAGRDKDFQLTLFDCQNCAVCVCVWFQEFQLVSQNFRLCCLPKQVRLPPLQHLLSRLQILFLASLGLLCLLPLQALLHQPPPLLPASHVSGEGAAFKVWPLQVGWRWEGRVWLAKRFTFLSLILQVSPQLLLLSAQGVESIRCSPCKLHGLYVCAFWDFLSIQVNLYRTFAEPEASVCYSGVCVVSFLPQLVLLPLGQLGQRPLLGLWGLAQKSLERRRCHQLLAPP